jgi:hypothetical protein
MGKVAEAPASADSKVCSCYNTIFVSFSVSQGIYETILQAERYSKMRPTGGGARATMRGVGEPNHTWASSAILIFDFGKDELKKRSARMVELVRTRERVRTVVVNLRR